VEEVASGAGGSALGFECQRGVATLSYKLNNRVGEHHIALILSYGPDRELEASFRALLPDSFSLA